MLAYAAVFNASSLATKLFAQSSKRNDESFLDVYYEALGFAVCLAQLSIQKKFKVKDGYEIANIITEFQRQFGELQDVTDLLNVRRGTNTAAMPEADAIHKALLTATKHVLKDASTDDFFKLVSYYASRDYSSLRIPDETLEGFCKITKQIPSIIKGASWTMVLLMFEIRTVMFLFEESALLEGSEVTRRQIPAMFNTSREVCLFRFHRMFG